MESGIDEGVWLRHLLLRSGLAGAGLGMVGSAGSAIALPPGAATSDAAVLIATAFVAIAVGIWAGRIGPEAEQAPVRDRWLGFAAVTAVAGAYATFTNLYRPVFPGGPWEIGGLILAVAVPAYAVGMLLAALLAWADRTIDVDDEEARLLTAPGSLSIGSLGGLALGLLLGAGLLLPAWPPGSILMATAILLLLPMVLPAPVAGAERENVLLETTSPYAHLRVTEVAFPGERQPERRLYLDGEQESGELARSGAPTLAYVAAAEQWLSAVTPPGSAYLFLGGGGYTLPRRIAERDRGAEVTVVEIDPEITRIAYRFFGIRAHHDVRTIHGDARAYLESCPEGTFDRIYIDVYGGRETLPLSLVTLEAATRIAGRLRPGGYVAMNLIGSIAREEVRRPMSVVRTYREVFGSVALYTHLGTDYPDLQNLLFVGAVEPSVSFPRSAGMFDLWSQEDWPAGDGTVVFRDVAGGMRPQEVSARPAMTPPIRSRAADG